MVCIRARRSRINSTSSASGGALDISILKLKKKRFRINRALSKKETLDQITPWSHTRVLPLNAKKCVHPTITSQPGTSPLLQQRTAAIPLRMVSRARGHGVTTAEFAGGKRWILYTVGFYTFGGRFRPQTVRTLPFIDKNVPVGFLSQKENLKTIKI